MLYKEMYESSLALGTDFYVNQNIKIRMPTVQEIIEYGERNYYRVVFAFSATSSDYKSQLFDQGYDWEDVSDFEMFMRLFVGMRNDNISILFGDLDLKKFEVSKNETTGELLLKDFENDIVIDKTVYECMSEYICAMHGVEKTYEVAADKSTKRAMIEEARDKLLYQSSKPYEPHLRGMVCSMANTSEFKGDYFAALKYPISIFMDCVHQVQKLKHFNYTMQGIYAGTVDIKKVPKAQLNWLKGS